MPVITCAPEVLLHPRAIEESPLFRNWIGRFGDGWDIEHVHVNVALSWGGSVRMAFVNVTGVDPHGHRNTVSAYLRGGTVDILSIVRTSDGSEYVALVEQSRFPVAQAVVSNPAGMVDDDTVEVAALRELDEEVGGSLSWSSPQWLNRFATGSNAPMLVSPGGTDEDVQFCIVHADVTAEQMEALQGSITGIEEEHEFLGVRLVPIGEALYYLGRNGRPDMKTVLSLLLYWKSR